MEQENSQQFPPAQGSLRILFAASEAQPLIKTGGLADVAGSLPTAVHNLGQDVRLILPAYPEALERAIPLETRARLRIPGCSETVRLLAGILPGSEVPLYLVDIPGFFDRPGNPYCDHEGRDWSDNPERFALFCRAVALVALDQTGLGWQPDLIHCNDWQTGLVPALLSLEWNRPAQLFTIHNLAYQGVYDQATFRRLHLPAPLWSVGGVEFHHHLSFIKGGIAFSDIVTTVSPQYAEETLTPEYGYGLEGLLRHRGNRYQGVLNGIDYQVWNPATDPALTQHYDALSFELKQGNKTAVQQAFGLPEDEHVILFGYIGRLVEQKGISLLLKIIPSLMDQHRTQLVMLGTGDPQLEQKLGKVASRYPDRLAIRIGYDEPLAHCIEAGCDSFLMPSLFEPCGLNQLYSLRYGTVPVVRRTGGLADTVMDVTSETLLDGTATGFVFDKPDHNSLWAAIERLLRFHQRPRIWWKKLAVTGMSQDFSWDASAQRYLELYQHALNDPAPNPLP